MSLSFRSIDKLQILKLKSNSLINFTGGAIFVHAFGAYFGLAVSMVHRRRKTESSEHLEGSRYTTDIFAMVFSITLFSFQI